MSTVGDGWASEPGLMPGDLYTVEGWEGVFQVPKDWPVPARVDQSSSPSRDAFFRLLNLHTDHLTGDEPV